MTINGVSGWCFLLYLFLCLYSIAWAENYFFTMKRVFKMLCICLGAYALAERYTLRQLLILFLLIGIIPLGLSFIAEFYCDTFDPLNPYWRFGGGFHSIALGYHCGVVLIVLQPLIGNRKIYESLFLNSLLLLTFGSILLTKSRMSFAAAMIGLVISKYLYVPRLDRVKYILLGMVFLSGTVLFMGDMLNLDSIMAMGRGVETQEMAGSLTGRIPLWIELLDWAANKPLLGWGYDSILGPANIDLLGTKLGWMPSNPHSDYVNAIVGIGYIGFLCFFVSYFGLAYRALLLMRVNSLYGAFAGLMIWMIFNSSMDTILRNSMGVTLVMFTVLMKIAFTPVEYPEKEDELRQDA